MEVAPPADVKDEDEEKPRSHQGRKVKDEDDSDDQEVEENTLMMESGIISAEALKVLLCICLTAVHPPPLLKIYFSSKVSRGGGVYLCNLSE